MEEGTNLLCDSAYHIRDDILDRQRTETLLGCRWWEMWSWISLNSWTVQCSRKERTERLASAYVILQRERGLLLVPAHRSACMKIPSSVGYRVPQHWCTTLFRLFARDQSILQPTRQRSTAFTCAEWEFSFFELISYVTPISTCFNQFRTHNKRPTAQTECSQAINFWYVPKWKVCWYSTRKPDKVCSGEHNRVMCAAHKDGTFNSSHTRTPSSSKL